MDVRTYVYALMYVCVYVYACTYGCMCMDVWMYVCTCIRICMWYMSTYIQDVRTYITSHGKSKRNLSESSHFPNPGSSYLRGDPSSGSAKGSEEEESRALHLSGVPDEPKISD